MRVPDDLLGLSRLGQVCAALEKGGSVDLNCRKAVLSQLGGHPSNDGSPAAALSQAFEGRTDDQWLVSGMLGVPVEAVTLGPNLLHNDGFEQWVGERLQWWAWDSWFGYEPYGAAAFVAGADELQPIEGQRAARIDGLYVVQGDGTYPGRAGLWQADQSGYRPQNFVLAPSTGYVLSFSYRTEPRPGNQAAVYLTSQDLGVFWIAEYNLPPTNGAWQRFVAASWNRSAEEQPVRLSLRMISAGSVEYDSVGLTMLTVPQDVAIDSARVHIQVADKSE